MPSSSIRESLTSLDIEVTISPSSPADFALMYDPTGGDATRNEDYIIIFDPVTVAAHAASVKIPIGILDDQEDEDAETVIMTLTEGSGYT